MASVDIISGFPVRIIVIIDDLLLIFAKQAEYFISAVLTFIVQLFYINTIRARADTIHRPWLVRLSRFQSVLLLLSPLFYLHSPSPLSLLGSCSL
jgi:hypothetical protein